MNKMFNAQMILYNLFSTAAY